MQFRSLFGNTLYHFLPVYITESEQYSYENCSDEKKFSKKLLFLRVQGCKLATFAISIRCIVNKIIKNIICLERFLFLYQTASSSCFKTYLQIYCFPFLFLIIHLLIYI